MAILPTELVGSLPRPQFLQQAFKDLDSGKISKDDLVNAQDKAAEDSVKRLEETGEEVVTDGECVLFGRTLAFTIASLTRWLGCKGNASAHLLHTRLLTPLEVSARSRPSCLGAATEEQPWAPALQAISKQMANTSQSSPMDTTANSLA